MCIDEWMKRCIAYFKSGEATDEHWGELGRAMLSFAERDELSQELEKRIDPNWIENWCADDC